MCFNIEYIELVLENCEVITIDGKDIGYFTMEDIRKSAKVIGCNSFGHFETAETTMLEIRKDADKAYSPFGEGSTVMLFDRLALNDITQIKIHVENNQAHRYYVPWSDDEIRNELQKTEVGENGNLYIAISETPDKTIMLFHDLPEREWPWLREGWGKREKQ